MEGKKEGGREGGIKPLKSHQGVENKVILSRTDFLLKVLEYRY